MRILMVGFDAPWIYTGFAATLRSIGTEFIKRGYEVFSISGNFIFETDGPILHDGITVLSNKGMMYPDKDMFLRHYNTVKPDVVIAHNDFYRISYIQSLDKDIINKTMVWLPIEDTEDLMHLDEMRGLKNIAFTTKYGVDLFKRLLPNQRLFQINHQIGLPEASEDIELVSNNPELNNKFIVLRVDRNQDRKNWSLTFKSFQSFIKNYYIKDAILIAKTRKRDIVSREDLGQLVKELGIEDNVVFVEDDLSAAKMKKLYEKCDIFLSTTGSEGFGLSIGEAMSCGKPIVCTGSSPLFDVVGPGAGSFIEVPKKDYNSNMHVNYNTIDIEHASELLKKYYDDWKSGGALIKKEGNVARINSNRYKIERVIDSFEEAFQEMANPYSKLLISIATKNRLAPLNSLLTSIFNQTYRSFDVLMLDNSDNEDIIKNEAIIKNISLLNSSGRSTMLWKNNEQNAPDSHQKIFKVAQERGYEFVLKIDDDCILENDSIEVLMHKIQSDDKIGAVAGSILEYAKLTDKMLPINFPPQSVDNLSGNRQWFWDKDLKPKQVEHLYSSFIYRVSALKESGGFPEGLSKVAFREETLTTYPMFLNGWKLIHEPRCIMWHMKASTGGCRDNHIEELYSSDDKIYNERIKKMRESRNV